MLMTSVLQNIWQNKCDSLQLGGNDRKMAQGQLWNNYSRSQEHSMIRRGAEELHGLFMRR